MFEMSQLPADAPSSDSPIVAALAVVIRGRSVLLVQRALPPDAGRWGFPGGKVESGESLQEAARRELLEETGVEAEAGDAFAALAATERDDDGRVLREFTLIAVRCRWLAGEPVAADDACDARWVPLSALEGPAAACCPLCADVARVAREAERLERAAT